MPSRTTAWSQANLERPPDFALTFDGFGNQLVYCDAMGCNWSRVLGPEVLLSEVVRLSETHWHQKGASSSQ